MKKIMFNDKYGLTEAVLEGRKTMTRRLISNQQAIYSLDEQEFIGQLAVCDNFTKKYSRYQIGEVVAVAQAYGSDDFRKHIPILHGVKIGTEAEAALIGNYMSMKGWNNKMFVKADYMPHRIQITDIKVERLQDIGNEDCLREGIWKDNDEGRVIGFPFGVPFYYTFDGAVRDGKQLHWTTPKEAFSALIDRVSGKGTWDSNPWVFVYSFELVK